MKRAIADGLEVTMHYRLTLDDGTIADDSFAGEPLVYRHGQMQIVPGLERQLVGKAAGDELEIAVDPAEGYGEYDPTSERSIPRSQFPAGVDVAAGMSFQAQGPQGPMPIWVARVDGEDVVVTANHPLAGQRLTFLVQVLDVRDAPAKKQPAGDSG